MNFCTDFTFLNQQVCWGTIAGAGTGSVFHLLLGSKIQRKRPIGNPCLDSEVRNYDGEISIFVQCSWRLATSERIICTNWSPSENDGPMVTGLKKLIGKKVYEVHLQPETLDLVVSFDDDLKLSLFNNGYNEDENDHSYSVRYDSIWYSVKDLGILQLET